MTKISAIEIRNKFLNFFKEKDHMEIEIGETGIAEVFVVYYNGREEMT